MKKNCLAGSTIALSGDFGKERSHEKIKQWIEANGGTFTTKIDTNVTHLVCSRAHFKKKVAMVKEAKNIRGLHIVNWDWLEDSLLNGSRKHVGKYSMGRAIEKAAKTKAKKKAVRKRNIKQGVKAFEKGCNDFRDRMHSDGYHIYRDSTGFLYDITLVRADLAKNTNERYHMQLYESHSEPVYFAANVQYSKPDGTANHPLAPRGSSFEVAFPAFKRFFFVKTRIAWEERGSGKLAECKDDEDDRQPFIYTPPTDGESMGF